MEKIDRNEVLLYKISRKIGDGGFGEVFEGHHIFDGAENLVAIKVFKPETMEKTHLQRFIREIRIHSQLNHKNIIPIISFEIDDSVDPKKTGVTYYTMPLASNNLREFIVEFKQNSMKPMDDYLATYYFLQILEGVEYAHGKEIIHRDLKPENVLVFQEGENEELKISDFGLGKFLDSQTNLTTQATLGSDVYAAPEQYEDSSSVDNRADIYSLGKILYELLANELPVTIDLNKIPESNLKSIIRKATKSNREDRFRTIGEMKERIDMVMGETRTLSTPKASFDAIYEKYNKNGDDEYLKELATILSNYNRDYILYTQRFMNLDFEELSLIYNLYEDDFYEIVENYLYLINGDHDFNFTDKIADFVLYDLLPILTNDLDLYESSIDSIVELAYSHNRFYIARRLGRIILEVKDVNLIMIIEDVIKNRPDEINWVTQHSRNEKFRTYINSIN